MRESYKDGLKGETVDFWMDLVVLQAGTDKAMPISIIETLNTTAISLG